MDNYCHPLLTHSHHFPALTHSQHYISSFSSPFSNNASTIHSIPFSYNHDTIIKLILHSFHNPRLSFYNGYTRANPQGFDYDPIPITPFMIDLAKLCGVDLLDKNNDIVEPSDDDDPELNDLFPYGEIKCLVHSSNELGSFITFFLPHLLHLSNANYFLDNNTNHIYALPIPDVSYITIPHNLSPLSNLQLRFSKSFFLVGIYMQALIARQLFDT